MYFLFKKRALLALFYFSMMSSCSQLQREWQFEKTIVANPCYNSGKIYLATTDKFSGIELECTRSALGVEIFLNIYSLTFPRSCHHSDESTVSLIINEQTITFAAVLFEGEQRLHLPSIASELIIATLLKGESVGIRVGRYKTELTALNFPKLFCLLTQIPIGRVHH